MTKRKAIPVDVKREVLIEAGYRCAVPRCRNILAIDLHHLVPVAKGGGNTVGNLLALCPYCHGLHHRGEIPAEAIRVWKGMLVSLNEGIGREAKELLLLLALAPDQRPQWFTSDGVIRLAPMIVAGLVKVTAGMPVIIGGSVRGAYPWPGAYHVDLTEKGTAVVAAWKAGNTAALADAQRIGGRSDFP
jgi:HNH endonuclease